MAAHTNDGSSGAAPSAHRPARRVPRYAMRTVAHSAPEYANTEQDLIRQSFSKGNHTWMKEALPVELGPDSVNLLRRQRMERNRLHEPLPQTWSKMVGQAGAGSGYEYEYLPEDGQGNSVERRREQRMKHQEKREKIANHDWRHSSQEVRLKHEPLIKDSRTKETYPYLGGDQDLELPAGRNFFRMQLPLQSWKEEKHAVSKMGSFLTGKSHDQHDSRESRMNLPSVAQRLQKRIAEDWEGTVVIVSITDQDLVQIAFNMATVDSERGVMAYMNVLSKDTELLGSLGLRKVSQLWGMKRDFANDEPQAGDAPAPQQESDAKVAWVFFLLSPKWVRMRPTDAFYTVHPRAKGSAFRMSSAGSSVLMSLGSSVVDRSAEDGHAASSSQRAPLSAREARNNKPASGSEHSGPVSARGSLSRDKDRVDISAIERAVHSLPPNS